MRRPLTVWGLLLLGAMGSACSPPFAIFEDVGTDPHPPSIELVGVAYQPEDPEEGEPARAPSLQPAEGFVVRPLDGSANTILIRVRYRDVGADIQTFHVRDRDGSLLTELTPVAPEDTDAENPEFFAGTSGTADLVDIVVDTTTFGPHRMELWAEDSHESRSEKLSFTIQVEL